MITSTVCPRGKGIAMNKKTPLFEYEVFPVHKARSVGIDDLPKKHGRRAAVILTAP
jgi:hypothetical protein